MNITKDELMNALSYDGVTGVFSIRRNTHPKNIYKAGRVVGWEMVNGYIGVKVNGAQFYAHRLAWLYEYGHLPEGVIDHINGDRTDNRISNLRDVSMKINAQNLKASHKDSGCGLLGVTKSKATGKFIAQITCGSKKFTKHCDTASDAHDFYIKKKRQIHDGCTL